MSSDLPAGVALDAIRSGLSSRRWLPTLSQLTSAAFGTSELEVTGEVDGDWLTIRPYRPGERAPVLRASLSGRVTTVGRGCLFTGVTETDTPGAPVLVLFLSIVGLGLVAGVIGVIAGVVTGNGAAAMHWLPALIVPTVLLGFATIVIAISRSQARDRRQFLQQWLAAKMARDGSGALPDTSTGR
jgi:hypothetical protein